MAININGNNFTDMKKATEYFEKKLAENKTPLNIINKETAKRASFNNIRNNKLAPVLEVVDEMVRESITKGEFNCFLKNDIFSDESDDSRNLIDILESLGYHVIQSCQGLKIKWD